MLTLILIAQSWNLSTDSCLLPWSMQSTNVDFGGVIALLLTSEKVSKKKKHILFLST